MMPEMDASAPRWMSSAKPRQAAGLPQFLFQLCWMTFGLFLMVQVGGWFSRSAMGLMSPIWPASGLGLALALIYGLDRAVPAVYLGTLVSDLLGGEPLGFVYAGPIAAVLELVVSWFLLTCVTRIDLSFTRLRDFARFLLLGCLAGPLVGSVLVLVIEQASGDISVSQATAGFLGNLQSHALGTLIFGPFFLFTLRRQDFRPATTAGRYELLGYSLMLAVLVWGHVYGPEDGPHGRFLVLGGIPLLALLVAIRFGFRCTVLFLALFVFLIPAFVSMNPARLVEMRTLPQDRGFDLDSHGFVFLASLGCLLMAAFHEELSGLKVKFALAMSSANLCVWDWSPAGWSCHTAAWKEKFGLVGTKLIPDETVRTLVHPDDLEEFEGNFQKLLDSEIPQWSQSCRMRAADGSWTWVQIDAAPVRLTADDEVASVAGVMRDTTQEREAVQHQIAAIETEAQLRTLRAQINPHFLFNTLNSVRALIGRHDPRAKSMISSLSSLLREVLAGRDTKLQSVAKELEIVRHYLGVESIRFGERLRYRIDCPPDLLSQRLPGMVILTLVENAVKHGISSLENGGSVEVRIAHSPGTDSLVVFVLNDGFLHPHGEESEESIGLGLENTRQRIFLATDGRGSFEIHEIPGPRVEAIVFFPFDTRFQPLTSEAIAPIVA